MSEDQALVIEDKARAFGLVPYHQRYVQSFHGRNDLFVVIMDREGHFLQEFGQVVDALEWLRGMGNPDRA